MDWGTDLISEVKERVSPSTVYSVSHPPNCLLKIIEHYWSLQSGNDTKKPQEC